ncbi:glycosyltransferase family 2 protein [Altererythrobacter sp. GH1-8]|uniref:glycosyltransferase family 2 protein n=1 Tax=Altererythrobacter sp. GH1-8 TaxID=3349333 RepID=UPI00374D18D6
MKPNPKFIALLPVRDEGDIIHQCLSHALTWADAVFVYDTGSVDNTYDTVLDMAKADDRIRPIGSEPTYYNENRTRGFLFANARETLRDGDWFLRIDADEFHHIRPQDFVANKMRPHEGVAYHQYYDFQLTQREVDRLDTSTAVEVEREIPIEHRRKHYTISVYAEPRLCRYRASMKWPVDVSFPYNAGLVAKERLPIRHYPHRDPKQLARRCTLRAIMMADHMNASNWRHPDAHHWSVADWRQFVIADDAPGLQKWTPGTPLPEPGQINHVAKVPKRFVQESIYRLGLPRVMDMVRGNWNDDALPLPIPEAVQEALARELKQ